MEQVQETTPGPARYASRFLNVDFVADFPLGIVATCIALMGATGALRSGNRAQFNRYLRYRVA
jgi:uncharacterized membrane protein